MKAFFVRFVLVFIILVPLLDIVPQELANPATPVDLSARGEYLSVKIAVVGPGDEIYFWWGHIGLVIEDTLSDTTLFFDWGVFSFDVDNFYLDFAFGRPVYSCLATPAEYSIAHYKNTNRDLVFYTLDLPSHAKTELLQFAQNNLLPENRDYRYHHFRDNCATRVRDILDLATGGAFFSAYGEAPGRFTLRQHIRRHTWFSPFWDWALSFWMGQDIDRPITIWDEMFLPSEVGLRALDFSYTDSLGEERQFVSNIEIINQSINRPLPAAQARQGWRGELILGLIIALALVIAGIKASGLTLFSRNKTAEYILSRRLYGTSQALLGLCFGIVGFLLFFLNVFTDHDYTFNNINIIFINPLLLAAIPAGLIIAFSHNQKKRKKAALLLTILWSYVFLGGLLTIVLRYSPAPVFQQNQSALALILPMAFGCIVTATLPKLFPPQKFRHKE